MSHSVVDERIRGLRPPKPFVDVSRAHGSVFERERRPGARIEQALTVFLAGAECPFTCAFCDLWRWTIDGPTPLGALTRQLRGVLDSMDVSAIDRLKLYNASNFFDSRAVPSEDVAAIAGIAQSFAALTVESHASTIGPKTIAFAQQMSGRLEVAVGLETIHPEACARLNKRLDLRRFDAAAEMLRDNGIDLRVFVLLGAPYIPPPESMDWTLRTVDYAAKRGASVISIIPVRGGNGEMERLQGIGEFVPPTLRDLEAALDDSLRVAGAVVTADLWDAKNLPSCAQCADRRIARLGRMNLTGELEPAVECEKCS